MEGQNYKGRTLIIRLSLMQPTCPAIDDWRCGRSAAAARDCESGRLELIKQGTKSRGILEEDP